MPNQPQLLPIDDRRKDPHLWQRQPLGSENLWIRRPKWMRELFLGGSFSLFNPTTLDTLKTATEDAWRRLRIEHPEIAVVSSGGDGDGKRLDEDEVQAWIKRTMIVEAGWEAISFAYARARINFQGKLGTDEADLSHVYLHAQALEPSQVANIGFLFHIDHLCTDGIGIRILANCFFRLLAGELSACAASGDVQARKSQEIDWQRNAQNLRRPWIYVMSDNQKTTGTALSEAVGREIDLLRTQGSVCDVSFQSMIFKIDTNGLVEQLGNPNSPRKRSRSWNPDVSFPRLLQRPKHCDGTSRQGKARALLHGHTPRSRSHDRGNDRIEHPIPTR